MSDSHPIDAERRPRLLEQLRGAIRCKHYSYRTEQAYVHWVRRFILFCGKRHPAEMGETEVTRNGVGHDMHPFRPSLRLPRRASRPNLLDDGRFESFAELAAEGIGFRPGSLPLDWQSQREKLGVGR